MSAPPDAVLYTRVQAGAVTARVNTAGDPPFAVVSLGDGLDIHVNTVAAGREIAAAFAKAADLLARATGGEPA